MIKKLIEILQKEALSPNAFFILTADVLQYEVNIESECSLMESLLHLEKHKFIKITDFEKPEYSLRQKGIDFIKQIDKEFQQVTIEIKEKPGLVADKVDLKAIANEVTTWVEEYRNLFKGLRLGSKGDKGACINKLVRFYQEYPEHANKETIIKATKKYIDNEAFQNYKYLQRADYFIFKLNGKEETSRLASFCDEADEDVSSFTKML